jgi:hypothetical protein
MTLNLTEIITRTQRRLNALGKHIEIDGIDGQETWLAIAQQLGVPITPEVHGPDTYSHLDELAGIAESQIGTQEDTKHTNRGDAILKYQRSTNLDGQGWPWCAAFVDWCVEQLYTKHPEYSRRFPRPQTASAFGLLDWGRKVGCIVSSGAPNNLFPKRGDLVVYTFSHCGIVSAPPARPGAPFEAIEGNTNDAGGRDGYTVARKVRNVSSVKGFIRIPAIGGAA